MTAFGVAMTGAGALAAAGAVLATVRILRGPTILDRMIASDVLLTTVMIVLGLVMAATGRTDLLPVLLVLAASAGFATVAVARSVSRHDRRDGAPRHDPLATVPDAAAAVREADRGTESS